MQVLYTVTFAAEANHADATTSQLCPKSVERGDSSEADVQEPSGL